MEKVLMLTGVILGAFGLIAGLAGTTWMFTGGNRKVAPGYAMLAFGALLILAAIGCALLHIGLDLMPEPG